MVKRKTDCSGITKEFLAQQYIENQLSTIRIALIVGCDRSVIVRRLQKYGIVARSKSESGLIKPPCSEETKRRIGEKSKLKVYSNGYRQKLAEASAKRVWSDESLKKLSESQKNVPHWWGLKGDKNPMWKGGIAPIATKLRNCKKYREWSKAVRDRDGHKCQLCGSKNRLHAHHIVSFNVAPTSYDTDNGITLCHDCHWNLHRGIVYLPQEDMVANG